MPTTPAPRSTPEPVGGPLTDRWWWSAALRLIVGGGIIAYQQPVLVWGSTPLNWMMVAIGAAVVVWGFVVLLRDRRVHLDAVSRAEPGSRGPAAEDA